MACGFYCYCGCGQRCCWPLPAFKGRSRKTAKDREAPTYNRRQLAAHAKRVGGRGFAAHHPAIGVVQCPRKCVLAMGHIGPCLDGAQAAAKAARTANPLRPKPNSPDGVGHRKP